MRTLLQESVDVQGLPVASSSPSLSSEEISGIRRLFRLFWTFGGGLGVLGASAGARAGAVFPPGTREGTGIRHTGSPCSLKS